MDFLRRQNRILFFIVSDDLNDYIGGMGASPDVQTPNIDILSNNGTLFLNAYCPAPLCAPSRTSFLTGKDLYYTQVYKETDGNYKCGNFSDNFTPEKGNEEYFTIPQYLKDSAGYFTYNLNKIFHCYQNFSEYDSITADPCAKRHGLE